MKRSCVQPVIAWEFPALTTARTFRIYYEQGDKKRLRPHCYPFFDVSNGNDICLLGLSVPCLDHDRGFGFISFDCIAARRTPGRGRHFFEQALMDNALFPSKDGWHLSRYAAFLDHYFWLCRSVCWRPSLCLQQNAAGMRSTSACSF
jgi:hypothetical protein